MKIKGLDLPDLFEENLYIKFRLEIAIELTSFIDWLRTEIFDLIHNYENSSPWHSEPIDERRFKYIEPSGNNRRYRLGITPLINKNIEIKDVFNYLSILIIIRQKSGERIEVYGSCINKDIEFDLLQYIYDLICDVYENHIFEFEDYGINMLVDSINGEKPWEKIEDRSYHREIVRLLWTGITTNEVAKYIGKSASTISDRFTVLRKKYGNKIVPTRRQLEEIYDIQTRQYLPRIKGNYMI